MPRSHTFLVTLGLAVLGAAGCAGVGQSLPASGSQTASAATSPRFMLPQDFGRMRGLVAPATHSWMSPDVKSGVPLVYVLEGSCQCVFVYKLKGHNQEPIGQIGTLARSGPDWIAMGNGGYLWISFNNGTIASYARGATTPSTTLNDPGGYYPEHIAVDDAGTVYVANVSSTGGLGNLVLYQNGSTSPTQTLTDPSVTQVIGVAVDQKHDIFVNAVNTLNERFIGEFVAGASGSYTFTQLVAGQNPSQLYLGMQLDSSGNLVVSSQGPQSIVVYSPPNWNESATFGGTAGATDVAFTQSWGDVFAPYLNNRAVVEFAYPSRKQVNEIIAGLFYPSSVAVDPKPPLAP